MRYNRIILLVLDGCGCGVQPDFKSYHSKQTNTLGNLYRYDSKFRLPFLESLGLSQLLSLDRNSKEATFAKIREISAGNDTFAGIWEMVGFPFKKRFASARMGIGFDNLAFLKNSTGIKTLCNRYVAGRVVLDLYYQKHLKTHLPILYIADDGVLLLAGHKDVIPPHQLNECASKIAEALFNKNFARIITRPFYGSSGKFVRLEEFRKDYILTSLPKRTLLDDLIKKRISVRTTEHIQRILGFSKKQGILKGSYPNKKLLPIIYNDVLRRRDKFFMYVLQDTDNLGHRKDTHGFKTSLRDTDIWLKKFSSKLNMNDLLIITADHGCDPQIIMRGHCREFIPLLLYSPSLKGLGFLGERLTFADIGQTIHRNFGINRLPIGNALEIFK